MSSTSFQVPRHSFYWLFVATLCAILPHVLLDALWLKVAAPLLLIYRWAIYQGFLSMPNKAWRTVLLVIVSLAVWQHNGTLIGTEASTQLLCGAFLLKLLEMFKRRDAYVFLILGYFVAATTFLFYQGPLAALYVVLVLWLLTAALVGLNVSSSHWSARHHGRTASIIILQSFPLMLLLFVLVPRFGPLWSVPSPQGEAKTGMSDSMTLGDISQLSESHDLAFRATFKNQRPSQKELYWRGLVLDQFDGRTWKPSANQKAVFAKPNNMPAWWQFLKKTDETPSYQYQIILEPTQNEWLYSLEQSVADNDNIGATHSGILQHRSPLYERFVYSLKGYSETFIPISLAEREKQQYLQLPKLSDPQSRQLALQLRSDNSTDIDFANATLDWFQQKNFAYTHQPDTLGKDANDAFLFETQRGFCEHFASAYTFLMRAGGVPARVVVGYQGGEWNDRSQHLSVYQYHAHAWVEIWLEDRGWVVIDPTATVSPDRIEQERTVSQTSGATGSNLLYGNRVFLALRKQLDWLEFSWHQWVLNYDDSRQSKFLQKWLGDVTPMKLAVALLGLAAIVLLPVMLWALLAVRKEKQPAINKEFHWLRKKLADLGGPSLEQTCHSSPAQLVEQAKPYWPQDNDLFEYWLAMITQYLYAADSDGQPIGELQALRQKFRKLPKALK